MNDRIPEGWSSVHFDPETHVAVSVRKDFHGVLALSGDGTVRHLDDEAHPRNFTDMPPIARAVLIARLRAWADALDRDELLKAADRMTQSLG